MYNNEATTKTDEFKLNNYLSPSDSAENSAASTQLPNSNSDSVRSLAKERTDVALSLRVLVFLSFLTSTFFFNVDGGVFAPALL